MISLIELAGNVLLFLLVFGMSATVDFPSIKHQLGNTRAILSGLFLQFFVLPFIGFAVVNILDLDKATGITLMVLTSSPGGSYSNWWCSMFNADLALSVTMTAISTILSIVFLPLNLLLYAQWSYDDDIIGTLDWKSLFVAIAIVTAAILLGLFCSAKIYSRRFNVLANKIGNFAGVALIIFSFTMTNTGSSDTKIWSRDWKFYLGVALPCLLAIIFSNVLTSFVKLLKPERVTVSIECCYQNVGIATSVALTMFEGDELSEAMGVPLMYGICEMFFLGIYCVGAWKAGWTKAPKNASFFKIIATNYEVLFAEKRDLEAIEVPACESSDAKTEESSQEGDVITTYFAMGDIAMGRMQSSGLPKDELKEVPTLTTLM